MYATSKLTKTAFKREEQQYLADVWVIKLQQDCQFRTQQLDVRFRPLQNFHGAKLTGCLMPDLSNATESTGAQLFVGFVVKSRHNYFTVAQFYYLVLLAELNWIVLLLRSASFGKNVVLPNMAAAQLLLR